MTHNPKDSAAVMFGVSAMRTALEAKARGTKYGLEHMAQTIKGMLDECYTLHATKAVTLSIHAEHIELAHTPTKLKLAITSVGELAGLYNVRDSFEKNWYGIQFEEAVERVAVWVADRIS